MNPHDLQAKSTKPPPYQPSYDSDETDAIAAATVTCGDCGRTFGNKHAIAVHRARMHRPAKRKPKPPANGRIVANADQLRELVAKFDRLAEARAEIEQLEREIDDIQARLVKAWQ